MKLFKLMATTAVTAIAATALAVSASAMTATYSNGAVTLGDIATEADQYTLLVLNNDATTVTKDDIVQIGQSGTKFTTVTVGDLVAPLDANNTKVNAGEEGVEWIESATYTVRVGGAATGYEEAQFTVETTVQKAPTVTSVAATEVQLAEPGADEEVDADSVTAKAYKAENVVFKADSTAYWTATINSVNKKLNINVAPNVEGTASLGLIITGDATVANVALTVTTPAE